MEVKTNNSHFCFWPIKSSQTNIEEDI